MDEKKGLVITDEIAKNTSHIISLLGEDITREGLLKTPQRVAKSLLEICSGYDKTPLDVIENGIFKSQSSGIVCQYDIDFYSTCEHHLLPFYGKAHIAYVPNENIIGLSKIPKIVDLYAKRLQVQENLTLQILKAFNETIKPKGVIVVLDALHFCMMMRGIKRSNAKTRTCEYSGCFASDKEMRAEFLRGIN